MGGGEIDAAGTLVAGSLVAAEVDGAAARSGPRAETCLNCGTPVAGNFCGACGQSAHVPRSIGHIFHDLVHGLLHVDSKGWRTLPMLVFRPGRLTRDYVEGRRARYVAPFALFLFTIFLTYFTFAMIGAPDMPEGAIDIDSKGVAQLETELAKEKADLAALEKRAAEIAAKPDREPGEGAGMSGDISGQRVVVRLLEGALDRARQAEQRASGTAAAPHGTAATKADDDVIVTGFDIKDWMVKAAESDNLVIIAGADTLNRKVKDALKNPDLFFYRMQQSAYKFAFLLVPLSLPFVWLLFPFRRCAHLYDHAVFTLYSLSFISLLFVLAVVLTRIGLIGGDTAVTLCLLLPPAHMFVQLKGAYGLGVFGALFRTFLLSLSAIIVMSLFVLIIVVLGVA